MDQPSLELWIDRLDSLGSICALLVAVGVAGEFAIHVWQSKLNKRLDAMRVENLKTRDATIAQLSKDTAEANARAAEANEKAEVERHARLKIEERLTDRNLSKQQEAQIAEALRKYAGQTVSIIGAPTPEPTGISYAINRALSAAGWSAGSFRSSDPRTLHGITVRVGGMAKKEALPAAADLARALSACNLLVAGPIPDPPSTGSDSILVFVGEK